MANVKKKNPNWLNGLKDCVLCPRYRFRTQVVPGQGNKKDPKIFFVLDQSGKQSDKTGRHFERYGTFWINQELEKLGLNRYEDCYTTFVLKCRGERARNPHVMETTSCTPYLDKEFGDIRPPLTVIFGQLGTQWYMPGRVYNDKLGSVHETKHSRTIFLPHPIDVENAGIDSDLGVVWRECWDKIALFIGTP